jgi:hypothetical protein
MDQSVSVRKKSQPPDTPLSPNGVAPKQHMITMEEIAKVCDALSKGLDELNDETAFFASRCQTLLTDDRQEFAECSERFKEKVTAARIDIAKPAVEDISATVGERHSHVVQRLKNVGIADQRRTAQWTEAAAERMDAMDKGLYGLYFPTKPVVDG